MATEKIQSDGHNVIVGDGALKYLSQLLQEPQYIDSKMFVLVDENTHDHCWPVLLKQVPELVDAELMMIESGEESKNIEVTANLWRVLGELEADRNSVMINLGGGVIGDMGAFVASTFKRGIRFFQVPTTVLAMVDASVGGKAGIDLDHLKNEVGLFATPEAVIIWPDFIETLSPVQCLSGFAEIIKHGLIADEVYYRQIESTNPFLKDELAALILRSVEIKNRIVMADPKEEGQRKLLNFGHTIGHALESWSLEADVRSIMHGHAVAIGMLCEAWLSYDKKWLKKDQLEVIENLILKHYPRIEIDKLVYIRLLELMQHDKKNIKGKINFTFLRKLGMGEVNQTASREAIAKALDYYRQCSRP